MSYTKIINWRTFQGIINLRKLNENIRIFPLSKRVSVAQRIDKGAAPTTAHSINS